ncbi:MAG: helix-turn-helix transcriptional regulator [Desulfovibrionaceae bacterium]
MDQSTLPTERHSQASTGLLRLPQVLALIPVSKSAWWQGVKEGRYPAPVKLGPRTTAWRRRDLEPLLESGVQGA